jgi:D-apionolactonase
MNPSLSPNLLRYGSDDDLPDVLPLRAGPLSLIYTGGDLRYIRVGEGPILHRLYVAVRDHNWDTIPAELTDIAIDDRGDNFRISFRARHKRGSIDFAWDGRIDGDADGTLRFAMDGEVLSDFRRNRIGFCVLHPGSLAGQPCTVEQTDGVLTEGAFPDAISPHQPFFDMRAISHEVAPGLSATVRMEGDTFEMEDQRNWTDDSYKTYSTPLTIPYPVEVKAGERIRQVVTIALSGDKREGTKVREEVKVDVEHTSVGRLPSIGLGVSSIGLIPEGQIGRLQNLRIAHLRVDLRLDDPDYAAQLDWALAEAVALGVGLEMALHLGEDPAGQLAALRLLLEKRRPIVARWLIFRLGEASTQAETVALARQHLSDLAPSAPFGGGTNAYFTELNRVRPQADALDFVSYTVNPQVHAFDNLSLVETLATQATTVHSARGFVGDLPIAVTPITLRARFNPNATGPEADPAPGTLPPSVDPRQMSLFAAAWTLGSLKYLAESGVASATYFETVGWRGVVESAEGSPAPFPSLPGAVFPVYHLLADVGEWADAAVLPVATSNRLAVDGLALEREGAKRILMANLTNDPQRVTVRHGGTSGWLRTLDETNALAAMEEPELFRKHRGRRVPCTGGISEFVLLPYAVVRLDVA